MIPFLAFFPWIMRILEALPQSLTSRLSLDYEQFLAEKNVCPSPDLFPPTTTASFEDRQHRTIFHDILDSKLLPEEKFLDRLADEAAVTLSAGTLTTAWVLAVAIYYMLANPLLLKKQKLELEAAIPDPSQHTPLATLDTRPYLRAVIQESIRLGYGAPGRVCHIAPDETMLVSSSRDLAILPATPTCMTVYLMHHVESIFPSSYTFNPERWIENPRLDKHLFAIFRSWGSKECRFESDKGVLKLWETETWDVELVGAMVLTKVWNGTKGVRIRARK
ncbi:cytochrome P450 [Mollisia scopiformis]|uniref:Cytochrome P450 n=1 Tax=Mollisia scopiformis TaxID=149040 RepID=A0A194WYE6_MOLSC|nr:cytochrome P450 [Mollisia scopiformis]KUJ12960.1 cytochrome P450 [Mollisia scopiformis]